VADLNDYSTSIGLHYLAVAEFVCVLKSELTIQNVSFQVANRAWANPVWLTTEEHVAIQGGVISSRGLHITNNSNYVPHAH
jgi:hypothetical protein